MVPLQLGGLPLAEILFVIIISLLLLLIALRLDWSKKPNLELSVFRCTVCRDKGFGHSCKLETKATVVPHICPWDEDTPEFYTEKKGSA